MTTPPPPPGLKSYTVTRSVHGETVSITVFAKNPATACRLADERAAELREVR